VTALTGWAVRLSFIRYQCTAVYLQKDAWLAEYMTESAKSKNKYLKVVLKRSRTPCTVVSGNGIGGAADDNNVYANKNHACRIYQTIFGVILSAVSVIPRRYIPLNSVMKATRLTEHYGATQAWLNTLRIMTRTNTGDYVIWNSYPVRQFWANASYPNLGYADWHMYIETGRRLSWFPTSTAGIMLCIVRPDRPLLSIYYR